MTDENNREEMERIYRDTPLEQIPWNLTEPPRLLVDAVESGIIKPCDAVDLGCGAGNYSHWLARRGFDMTGLDLSLEAIKHAKALSVATGVECKFAAVDLLGDLSEWRESFDFAMDWEVLHHIFPDDRERYLKNVQGILRPGGKYWSVCFSDRDPGFGGTGQYRKTPLGTTLYFSSEDELRRLFEPGFKISSLDTVEILGKYGPHLVNVAWLVRS